VRLLVAGITGQLGAGIVETCDRALVDCLPLARPIATRGVGARLRSAFPDRPGLAEGAVEGDVTRANWGLDAATVRRLAVDVDGVLNVAGATNWAGDRRQLNAVNVIGAMRGYQLAQALGEASGSRKLYCYVSSIHAAGGAQGSLPEMPFGRHEHRTAYELSKWLGETSLLERAARDGTEGPALCIARVGGLLGNSVTGATHRRNSLYMLADRLEDLPLGLLPLSRGGRVDMLHRDVAAELLLDGLRQLHVAPPDDPEIVHVCAGESAPLTEAVFRALDSVDMAHRRRRPRTFRIPNGALLATSEQLRRYHDVPRKWNNMLIGLRYLSLDRVFERARMAALLERPLPTIAIEDMVRSAFEIPARAEAAVGGSMSLARFAG
jgi:nucleoside-diphosphate-sugar epimerase